jgi:hypothetical protein
MLLFLIVVLLFIIVPGLLVRRLYRTPIKGNLQMQLMGRGAAAGIAGGAIGATISSFIFGTGAYAEIGYLYWLLITAVLGMVFTFIIAAMQKYSVRLGLPARIATGGIIGIITAATWARTIRMDFNAPMHWFAKGVICMITGTGIVSGILGGTVHKGDGNQSPPPNASFK